MRRKGQRNPDTLLFILPKEGIGMPTKKVDSITITKPMAMEFEKLGCILRSMLNRQKSMGYSIMGTGIYTTNNELIYEKNYYPKHSN